jgi:hypothetical protein
MKFMLGLLGLLALFTACGDSSQRQEDVDPGRATESDSYDKDRKVPDLINR